MPGSDQPDTPLIINIEIPLSNYQHLHTSAFFSHSKLETTKVVEASGDILLPSFIKVQNFQRNQPHLPENTPITLITNTPQHEICAKFISEHENCEVVNNTSHRRGSYR
jgi:hypothetical protein